MSFLSGSPPYKYSERRERPETSEVEDLQRVVRDMQRLIDSQEILLVKYRETETERASLILQYSEAHENYMLIQHAVEQDENVKDAWLKFISAVKLVTDDGAIGVTHGAAKPFWTFGAPKKIYDPQTAIGKLK
jgi:hypothetical protein